MVVNFFYFHFSNFENISFKTCFKNFSTNIIPKINFFWGDLLKEK